ncbi:hypothetical protein, partial [Enterococcus faecium]|uniref:hypothetical protein n=1 Tax=Enterococcus faecium TaxID=1352 RepID=UPI002090DC19
EERKPNIIVMLQRSDTHKQSKPWKLSGQKNRIEITFFIHIITSLSYLICHSYQGYGKSLI